MARCDQLVIRTGVYGALPVAADVRREAERQGVKLHVLPAQDAMALLKYPTVTHKRRIARDLLERASRSWGARCPCLRSGQMQMTRGSVLSHMGALTASVPGSAGAGLPKPDTTGRAFAEQCILGRRSVRTYRAAALGLAEVGATSVGGARRYRGGSSSARRPRQEPCIRLRQISWQAQVKALRAAVYRYVGFIEGTCLLTGRRTGSGIHCSGKEGARLASSRVARDPMAIQQ